MNITYINDGAYCFVPNFIESHIAQQQTQRLVEQLQWRQDTITMFGKTHNIPRLHAWYGDDSARYTYSKLTLNPIPWHPLLQELRDQCNQFCQQTFNGVLANYYRNGQDCMGFHSDNEPELGNNPVIASISFGAERVLQMRHKNSKEKHDVVLSSGSLFVMLNQTQDYWVHGIARSKRIQNPRINLTFRTIKSVD